MPVSKRTRYEVLKRDNHTCRYCHATDSPLTVDHVLPTALGGSDAPDNLVAACRDCNAGKSSTSPDAALVADVRQVDLKWNAAITRVAKARARQKKKRAAYVDAFFIEWTNWRDSRNAWPPLPTNWEASLWRFYELGVPADDIADCVNIACGNERIALSEAFRYFAGCVWRVVTDMQDAAKALLEADDADATT